MSVVYLSRHSSRLEGTLERSISPELVEEAGEPVSSWISASREREQRVRRSIRRRVKVLEGEERGKRVGGGRRIGGGKRMERGRRVKDGGGKRRGREWGRGGVKVRGRREGGG